MLFDHRHPSTRRLGLALLLLVGSFAAATRAQDIGHDAGAPKLPPGLDVQFYQLKLTEGGDYVFSGPVTLSWRESKIQADHLALKGERHIEAEGNVLVVWPGGRIFGSRMTYDLEHERGFIEDASGEVLSEYLFWAQRVEKIGEDRIVLESATVTTCTQPLPYWSFHVSRATIRIEGYARMWNVRLRAGRAPLFYLPYLIWPVKEGRAAGLLLPEVHSTRSRGRAVSQELFLPLGRSADLTLLGRYYARAGFGGGGELRVVPNEHGEAVLNGFYIDDKVDGASRYRASHRQTQEFQNGFRMVADINLVSDDTYFSDFERELNLIALPTILARLEFSRNGKWTSLNVRELRREFLSSGLIQQTLPEIEWRGRNRQLGRTPLYLSFESSVASIQQKNMDLGNNVDLDADYLRGDLFPTLSLPWTPVRWLDIAPRVRYRLTHYTQSLQDSQVQDRALTRTLWSYGVVVAGPKFFRIYEKPEQSYSSRYKHTLEPRVSYDFEEAFDLGDEIIVLDNDVDRVSGGGDRMTYGVVQRLFARRPRAKPSSSAQGEPIVLPDGTKAGASSSSADAAGLPARPDESQPREPLEIASLELSQTRTFDRPLREVDLDGDGVRETASLLSTINLTGRLNPNPAVSLDLRTSYDPLFDRFTDVRLSGDLRSELARLRLSLSHTAGIGLLEDSTQVRLTSGLALLNGRLKLDLDGSFDANPVDQASHFPNKHWRMQYSTQCCTFQFERIVTDFASPTIEDRRDFYFRVDLRGVGKVLNLNY